MLGRVREKKKRKEIRLGAFDYSTIFMTDKRKGLIVIKQERRIFLIGKWIKKRKRKSSEIYIGIMTSSRQLC